MILPKARQAGAICREEASRMDKLIEYLQYPFVRNALIVGVLIAL